MHGFFVDLTLIIVVAALLSIVFRLLKQPPIVAYIVTGIIGAQLLLINGENAVSIESLASIGITLLLFILGMELKLKSLRSIGRVAIIGGILQIFFTTLFGFLIAGLLGFESTEAIYIGLCISLSSTIVIVKLLSDKRDLNSLYGKIGIGILLVQDFVAIIALIVLNSLGAGSLDAMGILLIFLKAGLLIIVTVLMSKFIFPTLVHYLSRSPEVLFLSSLAWALGFALFVSSPIIGFSIEIGGFLAGLALANSVESTQIISKMSALKDFFIVIFFVLLGSTVDLVNLGEVLPKALVLSLFVLLLKPAITYIILVAQRYTSRTSLFTGLSLGQVSEFSLILIALGAKVGGVSSEAVGLITITSVICFIFSPYFVIYNQPIYKRLSPVLRRLQFKKNVESKSHSDKLLKNHFVLIGADRMGIKFLETLKKQPEEVLAIDFNPDIIRKLNKKGYNAIFGDIIDTEIQEKSNIHEASVVFSTIPDYEDNIVLLNCLRNRKKSNIVIVTAHTERDKHDLLAQGADYVVMPYTIAAKSVASLINRNKLSLLE